MVKIRFMGGTHEVGRNAVLLESGEARLAFVVSLTPRFYSPFLRLVKQISSLCIRQRVSLPRWSSPALQ